MSIAKAEKLRVALVTNVYISAFNNRRGNPFHIWRAALEYRYVLLVSPAIVDELAGVLRTRFGSAGGLAAGGFT
jgi:predicted nucleic acid-binding protein